MNGTEDFLERLQFYIDDAVRIDDLSRFDWRRQTDSVRAVFYIARLFVDLGEKRVVLVDGHMSNKIKRAAFQSQKPLIQFFNRRCHDYGLKSRRVIILDAQTTNKTGGRAKSKARLHFHGFFEIPKGWSKNDLLKCLGRVFGHSNPLGQRQFQISHQIWSEHHSFNGVQAHGAVGKLFYSLFHLGATYRCLELNEDGKRSRKAPACRKGDNSNGSRLAKGIPSNFNSAALFCDTTSKQLAREAFELWVQSGRGTAAKPSINPPDIEFAA